MRQFELATHMGLRLVDEHEGEGVRGFYTRSYRFGSFSGDTVDFTVTERSVEECEDQVARDFFELLAAGMARVRELDR